MTEKIYFKNDNNVEKPIDQEILEQKEIFVKNTENYEKELESMGDEEELFRLVRNIEDSKLEKIMKKLSNRFEKVQVFSKLILTFSAIPIISGGMLTFCNSIGKNGTTDPLSSGLIGSGIVIFVEVALAARVIYQEYKLQKNSNEKWWEKDKKLSV